MHDSKAEDNVDHCVPCRGTHKDRHHLPMCVLQSKLTCQQRSIRRWPPQCNRTGQARTRSTSGSFSSELASVCEMQLYDGIKCAICAPGRMTAVCRAFEQQRTRSTCSRQLFQLRVVKRCLSSPRRVREVSSCEPLMYRAYFRSRALLVENISHDHFARQNSTQCKKHSRHAGCRSGPTINSSGAEK
jgi:hypothetical protein